MKFTIVASIFSLCVHTGHGFMASPFFARPGMVKPCALNSSPSDEAERMKAILEEESKNKENLAESAERLKSMTPDDVDKMIKEMEGMSPAQQEQLKAIGMDPAVMKKSMSMMRDNPQMMESVSKMMKKMTPEQLMEQSRMAQEQMSKMTPEQVEQAAKVASQLSPDQVDIAAEAMAENLKIRSSSADASVIDSMFRVAEFMSQPPSGGVTFQAFSTLPPITVLSGEREMDLSKEELAECWADGSFGATRVDRTGFERVWNEVREYFEGDIMEEARKTSSRKARAKTGDSTSTVTTPAEVVSTTPSTRPTVGENLTREQMSAVNEQVKKMTDEDMGNMLEQMVDMTPEQEAQMKAMGVDPEKMKSTAKMMNSNPMLRKAAASLMKSMTPEQMMKSSREAQERMARMSDNDST